MSLLKKYACMYGDLEFTHTEEEELGKFAARLMKIAMDQDEQAMVDLFKEAFANVDAESFRRINDYLEWLDLSEGEKNAALGATIGKILGPLSLALAASPLIGHGLKAITSGSALKGSLDRIYQMHPELRDDPNVKDYFQAVADFAPEVAKNPLVAGNVIAQMHRAGPSFVTPQLIRELIGIQGQTQSSAFMTPSAAAAATSKPTMELANFLTKKFGK